MGANAWFASRCPREVPRSRVREGGKKKKRRKKITVAKAILFRKFFNSPEGIDGFQEVERGKEKGKKGGEREGKEKRLGFA